MNNSKVKKGKQGGGLATVLIKFAETYGLTLTKKPSAT